jgi:hypothetical protein
MIRMTALAVRLGLAILLCSPALPNGGKAKRLVLQASVTSGAGHWLLSTEIVPIQYRLNTIRNKYKLIQIRVNNEGGKPLRLSRTADRIEVKLGPTFVPAIIDIQGSDPAFWDSLDAELRNVLAYPPGVDANEEESIFVFLPSTSVKDVPEAIRYKIAGEAAPILLRAPAVGAKL